MRDIWIVLLVCVVVYGVWYAAYPMRTLQRKYGAGKVPAAALRSARIAGVTIAVLAGTVLAYLLVGQPDG